MKCVYSAFTKGMEGSGGASLALAYENSFFNGANVLRAAACLSLALKPV